MDIYKPLKKDAEISSEVALVQAAVSLDAAGAVAERLNDCEALLNVAAMWMKMSDTITNFTEYVEQKTHEHEKEEVVKADPKFEVGFQRATPEKPEIIVEEDEDV